TTHL
ncbi:hypothetical protein D046_0430B, partial [Vibrio parahaemolyticus V-223/04]